jgi:hypothetical protein
MSYRIRTFIVAVLLVGMSAFASAQSLKELLGAFKKEVEKTVNERVERAVVNAAEEGCQGKDTTAEVSEINYDKVPSFVVETADGRKFQLRSLSIGGTAVDARGAIIANFLSQATAIDLSEIGQSPISRKYRVHMTYGDMVGDSSEGSGLKSILATALNNTLQNRLPSDFILENTRLSGEALDGSEWCVPARLISIRSIRYLK